MCYNALSFNTNIKGKIWLEAKKFHEKGLAHVFDGPLSPGHTVLGIAAPPSEYHAKIIELYEKAQHIVQMEKERNIVDKESEKKDLVAGHVDLVKILPLAAPIDVETCIPRKTVFLREVDAQHASWLDCCFVCGSSGANDVMMFCVDCGEAIHSFCSGAPIECMDSISVAGWRCSNCKICELTGVATKNENSLLYCECCDRSVSMVSDYCPLHGVFS